MLRRIAGRLRPTVTVSVTRERFTFATESRTTTIDSAIQVATDGRIRGFGRTNVAADTQVVELFLPDGSAANERAMFVLCRRGLSLTLGPWGILRPRVLVHRAEEVASAATVVERSLRAAGARVVIFMQAE